MVYMESELVGQPLTRQQRRDWRLILVLAGVLVMLVSMALPMFTARITQATTLFDQGSLAKAHFSTLVSGQHYIQGNHPPREALASVAVKTAPVSHFGSGYTWLAELSSSGSRLGKFVSLVICLLAPIVAALVGLALVLRSWHSKQGLRQSLIVATFNMALLSILALYFVWQHQFDFSSLLRQEASAATAPQVGFYGVLLGALTMLVGSAALKRETRKPVFTWWTLVFAVALSIWLLIRFKPFPYLEIWLFVSDGILVTLRIVSTSFGLILLVSLLGGLGRISSSKIIYGAASLYVELIRGIPLLVQLLFIWFALPQVFDVLGELLISISPAFTGVGEKLIDLRLDPFAAAVLGLTICYGAYGSEIFRAGISSIHGGQMEAARSLGMNYFQAMRYVILPQAVRVILPPIGNEFVALLKDSSLVSVLAVSDLTRRGREYMARTFLSFDTWIMVALCYLVLTLFSSRVVEFIESKTGFEH